MYFSEPFTRMQAWIDLLLLANHSGQYFYIRGNRVDVKRGEVAHSMESLAQRWRWSRGKVLRYISQLENSQMIVQQKSHVITKLSITNYNTYQSDGTTDSTTDGQQTVQQTDTNKNDKNDKNENKERETRTQQPKSTNPDYIKFNNWIQKKAPYCSNPRNFPHQITEEEFIKLKKKYSGQQIADIVEKIENRKDLRKRYSNLYLTVNNWIKKEIENG
jgi:DNA-binding transcriptional MocR family regulator